MASLRTSSGKASAVESVDADAASAMLASGQYNYVDVRMWEDYDKGHIAGARNVPYYLSVTPHGKVKNNCFVEHVAALHGREDSCLVGCRSRVRSRLATVDLVDAGFRNVRNLEEMKKIGSTPRNEKEETIFMRLEKATDAANGTWKPDPSLPWQHFHLQITHPSTHNTYLSPTTAPIAKHSTNHITMATMGKASVVESVDADAASALLASGQYGYVDVRMWEDYDKGHVAGARNVPYYLSVTPHGKVKNDCFVEQVAALHGREDSFLVGCRSGVRSRLATADLVNAGFRNVRNLEGGYLSMLKSVSPQPAANHQTVAQIS